MMRHIKSLKQVECQQYPSEGHAAVPKDKPKSLKVTWPTEMLFATKFKNDISRNHVIRETIADIMKNKDCETLQKLVCMATFAQEANNELDIPSLPEAIDAILELCQAIYAEKNEHSKSIISAEFDNVDRCLGKMESDIEEREDQFLDSFIHQNLKLAVESLE